MTHSRFHKFTKTLDAWTTTKGYLVPYQIDGPSLGGMAALYASHGGLFNLLNEVNSWRIGESFEGRGADGDILKTLVEGYGPQAGYEATELLEKVWTPEKLAGKSIPYLIYSEIREFNKMTNDQLVMMGFEGVSEESLLKKMNFLIMYEAGRFKGTSTEADAEFVLREIVKNSQEKPVLQRLSKSASHDESVNTAETARPDLAKASFVDVLENFRTTGSEEARDLLRGKFLKRIGPEHMEALVQRAVQAKTSLRSHEGVDVLQAVLNNAKITPPVSSENDSLPLRNPLTSPFLDALDAALSLHLYDGSIASKKMDLLNFIASAVYPEELPRTYEKTLDITKHPSERANADVWLARLFFMPSSSSKNGAEALWGERLIQDLKGTAVARGMREAIGFFYKEVLARFISRNSYYGEYSTSNLTAKQRVLVLREIKKLSPKQEESLQTASRQLWRLAGDIDSQVRVSALYAILSNPMYLVKIEGQMLQALYSKDSKYFSSISFLLDVGPEMAPQAKRIYDLQRENHIQGIHSCDKVFMGH